MFQELEEKIFRNYLMYSVYVVVQYIYYTSYNLVFSFGSDTLFSFGRFHLKGLIGNRTRHSPYSPVLLILIVCRMSCSFYLLIMGRTSRCSGCKMPHSEHAFGKPGKNCTGTEQCADVPDVDEDTAPPSQSGLVETTPNESTEATLASLLGAV